MATVGGLAAPVDRWISAADAIGKTADRIGVELNEEVARAHPYEGTTFTSR